VPRLKLGPIVSDCLLIQSGAIDRAVGCFLPTDLGLDRIVNAVQRGALQTAGWYRTGVPLSSGLSCNAQKRILGYIPANERRGQKAGWAAIR
jgi:hypothetical protein